MSSVTQSPAIDGVFAPRMQDALGGEATYTSQDGFWSAVGRRVVFVQMRIRMATLGTLAAGQVLRITGLPFTAEGSLAGFGTLGVSWYTSLAITANRVPVARVEGGAAYARLYMMGDAVNAADMLVDHLQGNSNLILSGWYRRL